MTNKLADELYHRLWSKAVGTDGYNKKEWQEFGWLVFGTGMEGAFKPADLKQTLDHAERLSALQAQVKIAMKALHHIASSHSQCGHFVCEGSICGMALREMAAIEEERLCGKQKESDSRREDPRVPGKSAVVGPSGVPVP